MVHIPPKIFNDEMNIKKSVKNFNEEMNVKK